MCKYQSNIPPIKCVFISVDLKPENILITFDAEIGKCTNVKLCDFGLSTKFNANSLLSDFCGSPGTYMI